MYWTEERRGVGFAARPEEFDNQWNAWQAMERERLESLEHKLASWEIICGTCWLIHREGVCDRESPAPAHR